MVNDFRRSHSRFYHYAGNKANSPANELNTIYPFIHLCCVCNMQLAHNLCQTSLVLVFLSSSSKLMSAQPLILSIRSILCCPHAFDLGIFPNNICDSNLFPFKICLKYLQLILPILSMKLSFLCIVFIINTIDFFLFSTDF